MSTQELVWGEFVFPGTCPGGNCPGGTFLLAILTTFFRRESGLILRCISSPPPPSPVAPLISSSSPIPQNTSLVPLITLLLLSLTLIPILFVYLKKRRVASIELEAVEVLEGDVFSYGSGVNVKRYEVVTGQSPNEGEHVVRSYATYREGMVP